MQSSTLLAPRELVLAIPFKSGLPMHQDWDWLIRVAAHKGVGVTMVRQPLCIWRTEDARASVGRACQLELLVVMDPARFATSFRPAPIRGSSPYSASGARARVTPACGPGSHFCGPSSSRGTPSFAPRSVF